MVTVRTNLLQLCSYYNNNYNTQDIRKNNHFDLYMELFAMFPVFRLC